MCKLKLTILLSFICVLSSFSQTSRFLHASRDISSNFVNHIFQDREGMIWVSTDNGLNRMDGAKNSVYYSEQDKNSNFSFFFQDSKGRQFACASEHILFYNPKTDKLIPIQSYLKDGKEVRFRAYGLCELSNGNVLAYTAGNGLLYLSEKNGTMTFHQKDVPFAAQHINCLMEDKHHRLWAATEENVLCWDGKKVRKLVMNQNGGVQSFRMISEDPDGRLWCTSETNGLWYINDKEYTLIQVPGTEGLCINSILTRRKDHILLGTNSYGALELDVPTMKFHSFEFQAGSYASNKLNIHTLYDDRDGNLWVGCYQKGIAVLPSTTSRFIAMSHNSPFGNFIGKSCVQALTCDREGNLWIACDGDGLYTIPTSKLPNGVKKDNPAVHFEPSSSMPRTIMSFYADSNGKLWMGTWLQGLWVMDRNTKACRKVEIPGVGSNCNVFSITEDRYGTIWIATSGEGLYAMNAVTGEFKSVRRPANGAAVTDKQDVIHNRWLNHLFMGQGDILYIATTDGVCGINIRTQSCLGIFKNTNHILNGLNINTVCQISDGRLFAGSSKGLLCYNPKTNETKEYSVEDGMEGNSVSSIIDDHKGSLWLSTNRGITQFDIKEEKFYNYSSANEMYNNEFSRNAGFFQGNGMIHFGGTQGVISFCYDKMGEAESKPEVFFTALYLKGKPITTETESGGRQITDTDILHAQQIELAYDDNSFSIELSSLNFLMAESIQYEFRIDGDEWQMLPIMQNTISFSNLSAGKHTLEVRAKKWNTYGDIRTLEIIVRHPWYSSWWAWILYIIAFAVIAYIIVRDIRSRKREYEDRMRLQRQEEISEAKIQFFMNISHEIRTPMTLIISPLQRLMQTDADTKRQAAYSLMNRNAQRIIQLVNQLLDVRKIDKGQMKLYFHEVEMVAYVRQLTEGFKDLCDTKNITVSFRSDTDSLAAWIDPMNFDKIIVNLLSNSFKYTAKGGHIIVSLDAGEKGSYSITVQDNGKGLTKEELLHVFDRFYQHHSIENQVVQGSGVGLNLTRSLVEMHHGKISVANNENGKGCHFTITLPLGNKHLRKDEMVTAEAEEIQEDMAPAQASHETYQKPVAIGNVEGAVLGSKKNMLIVEDDEEIQNYLKAEMQSCFSITCVGNGQAALDSFKKKVPDIIISDVMMPVMNGTTMLQTIRKSTTYNNIPVILLTAKSSEKDNIEALELGADAYITKPFNVEILRRTALNLVQRQQQLKNIIAGRQNPKVDQVIVTSPDERLMQRIMKVVNANLSNPALGNDLITREVGISRVHLYRKLKEMTNLSLRDFIKNIRLNEAARLLSEQHHNISDIAEKCGFDNVSYFTVVFKQRYGVPPSVYMHQKTDGNQPESESKSEGHEA